MISFLLTVVHTANILGAFSDPFEFEGDYGPEINSIREKVFERVVPREALAEHSTESKIQAAEKDRHHRPLLRELMTPSLIKALKKRQRLLPSFGDSELKGILLFVERYGNQPIFRYLNKASSPFLSLDKTLIDRAAQEGREFSLPLLNSKRKLEGKNSEALKRNLLHAVFTEETLSIVKPEKDVRRSLENVDRVFLRDLLGEKAEIEDLEVFCTPASQTFMYWLYHSLNLHLISQNESMINDVNKVKKIFSQTIGDPKQRAASFRKKLITSNTSVLFTQECDEVTREALTQDGLFHPIEGQITGDGCFVFLRSAMWNPSYEILSVEEYPPYEAGRLNLILATQHTGETFLLASGHGHSRHAEDGRLQLTLIMDEFDRLQPEYANLQLLIGMDANTKKKSDVTAFQQHLNDLGLIGTHVGPTTVKRRMVTSQHSKAGKLAIDQEDYLIILAPEQGGTYQLTHATVGFHPGPADPKRMLPDIDNPSDHYAVGVTLEIL